ncbi:MAG: amidohydrolase family protein [Xanthomonadales bacterium]|nr:amidohydrolase family protein [Xanthomonadales bacterium]
MTPLVLLPLLLAPESAAPLLVECGALFDPERRRMEPRRWVVVEGERIREVAAAPPADFAGRRVDLSAFVCLPGLIDLHTHLAFEPSPQSHGEGFRLNAADLALRAADNARKTLHAGFTTVRDLGDRDNVTVALREAIAQGRAEGPRILTAAKSIASTGGHADPTNGWRADLMGDPGPREGVVNDPGEARKAVRQRYKDGADWIKITATGGVLSYARSPDNPQFTDEELAALVAAARDYGFRVAAHAHGREGARRAILAGVDTLEHGTFLDEELFALMKKRGTVYVPTLTAGVYVGEMARVEGHYPAIVRPKALLVAERIRRTFAAAWRAGVPIAFGSDAGVFPHGENAREFELMAEAGMPMAEALAAATLRAARVLGLEAEIGSLEAGKRADLVAVAGDPLADPRRMREVVFVMRDGRIAREPR